MSQLRFLRAETRARFNALRRANRFPKRKGQRQRQTDDAGSRLSNLVGVGQLLRWAGSGRAGPRLRLRSQMRPRPRSMVRAAAQQIPLGSILNLEPPGSCARISRPVTQAHELSQWPSLHAVQPLQCRLSAL